jgi:DNA-binding NarL/FixJ family response regulator
MIRIILVEDQKLVLSSLALLLEKEDNISVVAEASGAQELLSLLQTPIKADIVISDILMPKMTGIEMTAEMKKRNINIPVILLSMLEDEKYTSAAFLAGASGYISKNVDIDELLFAINTVIKGKRYFTAELGIKLLEKYHKQLINAVYKNDKKIILTEREQNVLELIAEGKTNQEMADQLFLSRRTIEGIRQAILDRTGAKNTAALIKYAILNGHISS